MAQPAELRKQLLRYALSLPGARVDHPWGEDVAKVGGKIFAFFGMAQGDDLGMGVKLMESNALALSQPGVTPSGYGLGKAGWVSVRLGDDTSFEMLRDWIDESYREIAPKKLVREMAQRAGSDSSTPDSLR
jgi:predicted DNA-binding protein (MmcQ/YjbR family)